MQYIKKFINKIRVYIMLLFGSMREADKLLTHNNTNENVTNSLDDGIHEQIQQDNVFVDMLKGELTERVKAFRYHMYMVERAAERYERRKRNNNPKNSFFAYKECQLNNSNDLEFVCVQENKKYTDTLMSQEVHSIFKIGRDFLCGNKIEDYTNKIAIKNIDDEYYEIDFYLPKSYGKFNNKKKFFYKELYALMNGDNKNEIADIVSLTFESSNASYCDDMITFHFVDFILTETFEYNGEIVIRYIAKKVDVFKDAIVDVYHQETQEKYDNREAKENATITLDEC